MRLGTLDYIHGTMNEVTQAKGEIRRKGGHRWKLQKTHFWLGRKEFANKPEEGRPKRQEGRGYSLESKAGDQEGWTNSV